MDTLQLQELIVFAKALKGSADLAIRDRPKDFMIFRSIGRYLTFLIAKLDDFQHEDGLHRYSALKPKLDDCQNALVTVQRGFDELTAPSGFSGCKSLLEEAVVGLRDCTNSLSMAFGANLYSGSECGTNQTEVDKDCLDAIAEEVMDAGDRWFQPSEPDPDDFPGFTVNELTFAGESDIKTITSFGVICPRAYLSKKTIDMIKGYVEFQCCCHEARHQSLLHYKRWTGRSLLQHEICFDGLPRWSMMLLKSDRPVAVRLSDISPMSFIHIEYLAGLTHRELWKDIVRSPTTFGGRATTANLAKYYGRDYTLLRWAVNDFGFPGTKIRTVTADERGLKRTLCNPTRVKLNQYHVIPSFLINESIDEYFNDRALPEPYTRLVLEGTANLKKKTAVLVTKQTSILHEKNPLGKLVVTLTNAAIGEEGCHSVSGERSNVNFTFDSSKDAKTFARYIDIAKETLRRYFVSGPVHGEKRIYFRGFPVTSKTGTKRLAWFEVMVRHPEGNYHAIISIDNSTRNICIEINADASDVAGRGLRRSLKDTETLVSDYDQSRRRTVSQTTWKCLMQGQIAQSNGRATCVKGGHERTADDWLEEIAGLIKVMRGKRNDRYERVKIAIVDSGLNDTVISRYMTQQEIVYKDFTNETRNDSWHGTCCAKIISDIYDEAMLFVARIFEREDADEKEGPIRMAQAIDWAISPPNSVDIISISAGFRDYSEELDKAVTRANAAGILVIAAAANWQNTEDVAYPARHNLTTMCMYSTNTGNQGSGFNPEPRRDAPNLAILGEGFHHPDQKSTELMSGTSMATAAAVGLAASIIDFSRQEDNKSYIHRARDVGKLPGMLAIFHTISKGAGKLRYVAPLKLLPLQHGTDREMDRQRARVVLSQAMERAN